MEIVDQGYIYDAAKAAKNRSVCSFTSLCRLSDGKVLASFRAASGKDAPDGNCIVAGSTDGGANWEILCEGFEKVMGAEPEDTRAAEIAEVKEDGLRVFLSCLDRSKKGRMYDSESDRIAPSGIATAKSSDGGRTWQKYRFLDTAPAGNAALTGQTVHIPGRGWLVFVENYEPEEAGGPSLHSAFALFSRDGENFDRVVHVARHPENKYFYWDQRQVFCEKSKRIASMFWTYERQKEEDVDIHMAWGNCETLNWEEPFSTGIRGQIAAPIPLGDGRLLCFYVHRHSPGSMRLIMSSDDGRSWDQDNELVVYESKGPTEAGFDKHSDYAAYWENMSVWSFGHPAGAVVEDGVVLLAYYAGPNDKCLSVRWARVRV